MKEDVVAANLANLRQSINELKECIEKQNVTVSKSEQSVKVDFDEKTIYNGVAKSLHIPADTRSAFPVISVQSPVSIQCCWQS